MADQTAQVEWREGAVPVSTKFDDPYFSLNDGLAETRHVFLDGNDLPARFCDEFHIAELGFGTGLNLWASVAAWRSAEIEGTLHFTSFEAYPMRAEDMRQALAHFPEIAAMATRFLEAWADGETRYAEDGFQVEVILGDATRTLPQWQGQADAWFLDGFAPAKNPVMWNDALLQAVGARTRPDGSFATFTAAGHVRRALEAAGFEVTRIPGFGRKRHMSIGRKAAHP